MDEINQIKEEFYLSLIDLKTNNKPMIIMLTMLAEDYKLADKEIAEMIKNIIYEVDTDRKLLYLYLIDSICKEIGLNYTNLFSNYLIEIFSHIYSRANDNIKSNLIKLRTNWSDGFVFKKNLIDQLDYKIKSIDKDWPFGKLNSTSNLTSSPLLDRINELTSIHKAERSLTGNKNNELNSFGLINNGNQSMISYAVKSSDVKTNDFKSGLILEKDVVNGDRLKVSYNSEKSFSGLLNDFKPINNILNGYTNGINGFTNDSFNDYSSIYLQPQINQADSYKADQHISTTIKNFTEVNERAVNRKRNVDYNNFNSSLCKRSPLTNLYSKSNYQIKSFNNNNNKNNYNLNRINKFKFNNNNNFSLPYQFPVNNQYPLINNNSYLPNFNINNNLNNNPLEGQILFEGKYFKIYHLDEFTSIILMNCSTNLNFDQIKDIHPEKLDPRAVYFEGSPLNVYIDESQTIFLSFDNQWRKFSRNNYDQLIKFGTPGREIHLNNQIIAAKFGGPAVNCLLNGDSMVHTIRLDYPAPRIKLSKQRVDLWYKLIAKYRPETAFEIQNKAINSLANKKQEQFKKQEQQFKKQEQQFKNKRDQFYQSRNNQQNKFINSNSFAFNDHHIKKTNSFKSEDVSKLKQAINSIESSSKKINKTKLDDDFDDLELTVESLRKPRQNLIDSLYKGVQCTNCSLRFSIDNKEGKDKYSQHLDWHFRLNRKQKDNKSSCRDWYYSVDLWTQFKEINLCDNKSDEEQNNLNSTDQLKSSNTNLEKLKPVKANSNDKLNFCSTCLERFNQKWCDDEDEWLLKNAVELNNLYYHPLCVAEAKKALEEGKQDDLTEVMNTTEEDKNQQLDEINEHDQIEIVEIAEIDDFVMVDNVIDDPIEVLSSEDSDSVVYKVVNLPIESYGDYNVVFEDHNYSRKEQSTNDNNLEQSSNDNNIEQSSNDNNLEQSSNDNNLEQSLNDNNIEQSALCSLM